MNDSRYKHWWEIHVRVCRGEELSDEERAVYEVGLRELHDEERFTVDVSSLRRTRQETMELDAKCEELQARRHELKYEISKLESALSEEARKALGIQD
jgi:predicted RNase H-like nuclease (RuvC/YqgF family)